MSYVKTIAIKGIWTEISLTPEQERNIAVEAKQANYLELQDCIVQARKLAKEVKNNGEILPMAVVSLAVCLFDKRAKHVQYFREAEAHKIVEELQKPKTIVQSINSKGEVK